MSLLTVALAEYGLRAVPGAADNPRIMGMAQACGFLDYSHDSRAWCSLFMNFVALKAGFERSNSLAARSWLSLDSPVDTPELGDLVIFWRDDPKGVLGHVGLWISNCNGLIYTLGGNEGGMVQIEGFDPSKLLGYRRLKPIV